MKSPLSGAIATLAALVACMIASLGIAQTQPETPLVRDLRGGPLTCLASIRKTDDDPTMRRCPVAVPPRTGCCA